jgi:hypothetical protein
MFARIMGLVLVSVSAATAGETPPKVSLTIPEAFNFRVSTRQFRKGQSVVAEPDYARMTALASFTEYFGFGAEGRKDKGGRFHGWTIHVYRGGSQKVMTAYAQAKDGYEARLNECPEFLGCGAESYMYARFERKHFVWGDAVSFFSQSTQDTGVYVPHNGHLEYEVWAVTHDHKHTVVAQTVVTHPKLAEWGPEVRDAGSIAALKRDRDYKLVETCSPDQFTPSLAAFDRMLESLGIR